MDKPTQFIKIDDDIILNMNCIRWVKKMDECLHICSKSTGCIVKIHTHKICKINNPSSYDRLNWYF